MRIGLDIGSTTLKAVVLDDGGSVLFERYERHFSQINEKTAAMLGDIRAQFGSRHRLCISGSAGMGLAEACAVPFAQEVYATRVAVERVLPHTDAVIELGGEDAKILFLSDNVPEVRMNGTCAGGTGAFIDQMATLLRITPDELNELAKSHEKRYTVASRCGVFAKSDVQPLLNQGARKQDIAASILYAVVNQTVAGLAQGREIKGNVVYLGGPMTFLSELRKAFDDTLGLRGTCPDRSLYFVATGAALMAEDETDLDRLISALETRKAEDTYLSCPPLFRTREDYDAFLVRHAAHDVLTVSDPDYDGGVFLGIDAGSTTAKIVAVDTKHRILYSQYRSNGGNPIPVVKDFLEGFYAAYPKAKIIASAVTGYGEDMIKNAFCLDFGIVETVAHFTAAKAFRPDVDFIIDIGGQDMKCFKIRNGAIDNIFLNEACSSGCGSFLQTFAGALGMNIAEFAEKGIFADRPVDLGSRCTVFMNSSVKQAQKDGASVENISAGLSISVVKNAIYKVIRAANADDLGQNIVVQGGTFLNNAVLRAFEQEIGRTVIRPNIAGLMGAYGAALYAEAHAGTESGTLGVTQLQSFTHDVKMITCKGCTNHCALTVNTFDGGRRFIGGNRCERPLAKGGEVTHYNLYKDKLDLLAQYKPVVGPRGKIGIPMGLNMYEMLPFWHTVFTDLGFEVVTSPRSDHTLYQRGQTSIPSDTACYPAKLIHGHIEALLDMGLDTIFYPCLTYNFNEKKGDNHYNCPVVAYYPEVIRANMPRVREIRFLYDYLGIHRPHDFTVKFHKILCDNFGKIPYGDVKKAVSHGYETYEKHMAQIRAIGEKYLHFANEHGMPVIVLAGRPYHIDPEINHGIDRLICELGAVVVSEDAVAHLCPKQPRTVLNQWTYHARMYDAARFVATQPNLHFVQLVSFGCGVDAVTTDECRAILESQGKIYTQIKIDEITNLGAVRIRLRSLFAAMDDERGN